MTIDPGYSGQEFMADAYGRIERLRELVDCHVQVDGGVKEGTSQRGRRRCRPARRRQRHLRAPDLGAAYRRLVQLVS